MTTVDEKIKRLKDEARERWGERWTVEAQYFADGDTRAYAVHSRGRTSDGNLEEDRLFADETDGVYVERVTLERRELDIETIETPADSRSGSPN